MGNKVKTNSATKKRFRVRKGGTVKYSSCLRRHLLTKKTKKRKRQLRKPAQLQGADAKRIAAILIVH